MSIEQAKATLAKNVLLARAAKEITQEELAEASGLSRATIAQIESADGDPRLSTIADIANALEINMIFLLLGKEELGALVMIIKDPPKEFTEIELSVEDVEKMERLVQAGMFKSQIKAARMGVSAAQAAGLTTTGAIVGAAIASTLLPGLGTVIGAVLGGLIGGTTKIISNKKG